MKPFNLNDALAGHSVVTRNGRKVTQLHFFHGITDKYCLYGVIDEDLHRFTEKGYFFDDGEEHVLDLFMECLYKDIDTQFINLYKDRVTGEIFAGQKVYSSEQDAKNNVWNDTEYYTTTEVTIEK